MTDIQIRDRIIEFKRMLGRDLMDNEGNWRLHPRFQRDALRGVLGSVGIADVLKVYWSERQGGWTLVDGHLRTDEYPDVEWPVVVLDITDEEADLLLATFDPLAALAGMDKDKTLELTEQTVTDDLAVRELLQQLQAAARKMEDEGPPEMALQPFEHYDYIVLMFKTTFDFEHALDLFGIQKEGFTVRSSKKYDDSPRRKTGIGRVINGAVALDKLCNLKH